MNDEVSLLNFTPLGYSWNGNFYFFKDIAMTNICGWCGDGFHESCKPIIHYNDKVWNCSCSCKGDSDEA